MMASGSGRCVGTKRTLLHIITTGAHLTPLINVIDNMLQVCALSVLPEVADCIEYIYDSIVSILNSASSIFVPQVKKAFYKFWWNEELSILKQAS